MKTNLKRILLLAIAALLIGLGVGVYMFNKPHKDIESAKADFTLPATELVNAFLTDEQAANGLYLNKVIEVDGVINQLDLTNNGLGRINFVDEMEGLSAVFDSVYVISHYEELKLLSPGQTVRVKGRCDGYMMLNGVSLNKCSLVKTSE